MVGRLDPKTGEVKIVTSPTPKSPPYGMGVNQKRRFFVEFGGNKIAKIDSQDNGDRRIYTAGVARAHGAS